MCVCGGVSYGYMCACGWTQAFLTAFHPMPAQAACEQLAVELQDLYSTFGSLSSYNVKPGWKQ